MYGVQRKIITKKKWRNFNSMEKKFSFCYALHFLHFITCCWYCHYYCWCCAVYLWLLKCKCSLRWGLEIVHICIYTCSSQVTQVLGKVVWRRKKTTKNNAWDRLIDRCINLFHVKIWMKIHKSTYMLWFGVCEMWIIWNDFFFKNNWFHLIYTLFTAIDDNSEVLLFYICLCKFRLERFGVEELSGQFEL